MCKQCARSSQCANITGTQNFLSHSEGVSKVTPQIRRGSGLGGQKNCFTCGTSHNFGHHKHTQVWKPLSLASYMLYMADWTRGMYMAVVCFTCALFCVLLFGYTERLGVLETAGHGCTPCSLVRCRWSSFLVRGYSMATDSPCCCQCLQGEARQPSIVLPPRPLSQSSGKHEPRSWLVLQTSIKTLNLIHN